MQREAAQSLLVAKYEVDDDVPTHIAVGEGQFVEMEGGHSTEDVV